MKKFWFLVTAVSVVFVCMFTTCAAWSAGTEEARRPLSPGDAAPAFALAGIR